MKELAYVSLANRITTLIDKGIYKPGDKLPSLRSLHKDHGLSIGTVLQAFNFLIDKGLVDSQEKSGYFVSHGNIKALPLPQAIPASLTEHRVQIDRLIQTVQRTSSSRNFVSFAIALPDHRLLPFNSIKRAIQQTSRDTSGSYLMLEERKGNPALRKDIAQRSLRWKGATHPDEIIITNGATEAILCCLKAVVKPGDTILVQDPCFYGIMQVLECLDCKIATIPSHPQTGIDIVELKNACRKLRIKACVLVSNFNNPDGASIDTETKKAIAAFANETSLPIVEDDLYGELYFQTSRPDTIKAFDTGGWIMYCNAFTKTLSPGMRIGWCAAGRFTDEVARIKSMHNGPTANFTQRITQQLIHSGQYDRHLHRFRLELHKNSLRTASLIQQHFPKDIKFTQPNGGLVIWIQFPETIDTTALLDNAFEKETAYTPGLIFSAKGDYKNYLRISYCNYWEPKVEKALIRLGKLFQSVTP